MVVTKQKHRVAKMAGVKLTPIEHEKIHNLVESGAYLGVSDFMRDAVRDKLDSIESVKLRDVDYKTAKKEVLGYYEKYPESYPSDIANTLGIDLELVYKIVNELVKEKRVEFIE